MSQALQAITDPLLGNIWDTIDCVLSCSQRAIDTMCSPAEQGNGMQKPQVQVWDRTKTPSKGSLTQVQLLSSSAHHQYPSQIPNAPNSGKSPPEQSPYQIQVRRLEQRLHLSLVHAEEFWRKLVQEPDWFKHSKRMLMKIKQKTLVINICKLVTFNWFRNDYRCTWSYKNSLQKSHGTINQFSPMVTIC